MPCSIYDALFGAQDRLARKQESAIDLPEPQNEEIDHQELRHCKAVTVAAH